MSPREGRRHRRASTTTSQGEDRARERARAAKLAVLERWMSVEFPSFGRWVSPERAERIARRAAPGTFSIVFRAMPASTWAECDYDRRQILLPPEPIPLFVVLHELGHAWAPVSTHSRAFLESYQLRVWEHFGNAKMSRAFEKGCALILK